MSLFNRRIWCSLLLVTLLMQSSAVYAQTYSVLYNFGASAADGQVPYNSFIASGSTLYGATTDGGANSSGTIFSFNTANNNYQQLYSFAGGPGDGENPIGGMTLSGNILYGSTTQGGADATSNFSGDGAIFSFNLSTQTESLAYSFPGGNGGSYPDQAVVPDGPLFYGITNNGGTDSGGTIFSLNPSTDNATVLHSFAGGATDGFDARYGTFVGSGSTLYGVTSEGGQHNDGAVYSFNTTTNNVTVLHAFDNTDGYYPEGGLTLSGQTLYGTTSGGGLGYGVLYSYNLATSKFSLLYQFDGSQGQTPTGELVSAGSMLYGMTEYGGPDNDGTIFSFNTATDVFSTLHNFDGADGSGPWQNDLLLMNNALYGMSNSGGQNSDGVIFAVNLPEPSTIAALATVSIGLLSRGNRRTNVPR